MTERKPLTVIGLMSGTTFDGIDIAIIKTDGEKIYDIGPTHSLEFPEHFRDKIRKIIFGDYSLKHILEIEDEITLMHCKAVKDLLKQQKILTSDIDLVAFHGQTIYHDSKSCKTWQLANGALMAKELGIDVITDFRRKDLAHGGEGAPLVPYYHKALAEKLPIRPVAFLNIGGVSNVTYIDENLNMKAFDTGPGCALLDDWMHMRLKRPYDYNGEVAKSGIANTSKVDYMIENYDFFKKTPPKSLDRNDFTSVIRRISTLTSADGAATLVDFTARSIYESQKFFPSQPKKWVACGGGRRNKHLLNVMREKYKIDVEIVDNFEFGEFKINGDFVEAQAFGYLGARCYYNMPITTPETTGAIQPASGGAFYRA